MNAFGIWTRIERVGRRRYIARVSGIPCGAAQRCVPEERTRDCGDYLEARAAAIELAKRLARDIRARGDSVVRPVAAGARPFSAPPPDNERRSRARSAEEA